MHRPAQPSHQLGTVRTTDDGRDYVDFRRTLAGSASEIWQHFADDQKRRVWFPNFEINLAAGGAFQIWFSGNCDGPAHVSGEVNVCVTGERLYFGSMRYRFWPAPSGTDVRFTDLLFYDDVRTRTDFANAVLGGWHTMMDSLEAAVRGLPVTHGRPEFDYASVDIPGRP